MAIVKQVQGLPGGDAALAAHMSSAAMDDPIYAGIAKTRRAKGLAKWKLRKAEKAAQRIRVTIDISQELVDALDQIAEDPGLYVPRSQVANYLMLLGLQAMADGHAAQPGWWEKRVSKSMAYDYNLVLPAIPDIYKAGKK